MVVDEAGLLRYFPIVRAERSASFVSHKAGTMTLEHDPKIEQSNELRMKRQAARKVIQGGILMEARAELQYYSQAETHQEKQPLHVLKEDEVLNLGPTKMVAFASGLVDGSIFGHWINHYDRNDFNGLCLNNPWHSKLVKKQAKVVLFNVESEKRRSGEKGAT